MIIILALLSFISMEECYANTNHRSTNPWNQSKSKRIKIIFITDQTIPSVIIQNCDFSNWKWNNIHIKHSHFSSVKTGVPYTPVLSHTHVIQSRFLCWSYLTSCLKKNPTSRHKLKFLIVPWRAKSFTFVLI